MFTFAFSPDEEPVLEEKCQEPIEIVEVRKSRELKSDELEKVDKDLKSCSPKYTKLNENLRFINNRDVLFTLLGSDDEELSDILKAEAKDSDLLPGIYEGGGKIWEATYDLINFIEKEQINLQTKKVLDLGCGAGLVGITCLIKGATCFFQDFNDEVLKYVTYPNVIANEENISQFNSNRCKYFCGDWASFVDLWQEEYHLEEKFDYIFTSETIYNPGNYEKLHKVFQKLLSPQGRIYLAAKTYYFSPGGGLLDFEQLLEQKKTFEYKTVWKHTNGLVREILEIKFIQT